MHVEGSSTTDLKALRLNEGDGHTSLGRFRGAVAKVVKSMTSKSMPALLNDQSRTSLR